jgi:CheY-like chemotaxis protein
MTSKQAVLVVDDDADNRETMCELICEYGYPAACAASGKEALEWLEQNSAPCLVLLDMLMPDMSGDEVVAEIGRLGIRDRVTVVYLTAMPPGSMPPGVRVLRKPCELETLLRTVEECCGVGPEDLVMK